MLPCLTLDFSSLHVTFHIPLHISVIGLEFHRCPALLGLPSLSPKLFSLHVTWVCLPSLSSLMFLVWLGTLPRIPGSSPFMSPSCFNGSERQNFQHIEFLQQFVSASTVFGCIWLKLQINIGCSNAISGNASVVI